MSRAWLLAVTMLFVASCGSAVSPSGVVVDMEYDDPDTEFKIVDGAPESESDGAHWLVWVGDRYGTAQVEVTEGVFNGCRVGSRFEAGECLR